MDKQHVGCSVLRFATSSHVELCTPVRLRIACLRRHLAACVYATSSLTIKALTLNPPRADVEIRGHAIATAGSFTFGLKATHTR